MKVQNINISPQFNGFKNVISHTDKFPDDCSISYMAMELDNKGAPDMDTWKYLQKELMHKDEISDCVVFTQVNKGNINVLALDDCVMHLESTPIGSKNELLHIKAFNFIASLTKRLQEHEFCEENVKYYEVLIKAINVLTSLFKPLDYAEDLSISGAMKSVKHYKTAKLINSSVAKRMTKYFN